MHDAELIFDESSMHKLAEIVVGHYILPKPGVIILLDGEMGAGKTTLVSLIVRHMKIDSPITSPTFSIINQYSDNIYHVDLWRLEAHEIHALRLDEILSGNNVVFVEWSDKLPKKFWRDFGGYVNIKLIKHGEKERKVLIEEF